MVLLGVSLHKNPIGERCGRKGGENTALFFTSQSNYWGQPASWEAGFGAWMRRELQALSPPPSALGQVDRKKNEVYHPKNMSSLCVSESPLPEGGVATAGIDGKHQASISPPKPGSLGARQYLGIWGVTHCLPELGGFAG